MRRLIFSGWSACRIRPFAATLTLIPLLLLAAPAAGEDLDRVREQGKLRFAMSGQYPPFNFVDEQNKLTGFDVEICSEIARRLEVRPEPLSTAWDGIVAGLLAGKYELICGSMAITPQRQAAIDFSRPYYRSGAQLFVGPRSQADSVKDVERLGVTLGTTYEAWVRDNLPEVKILTYRGVPEMILEVATGRIDGFITDRMVGAVALKDGAPIRMAGPLLYEELMGIALQQENPQLKQTVDGILEQMLEDGSYRQISMRWLGIDAR